ncbi:MAG TPA: group II intron reverse transcriptase/maturase, partial [Streptosporangiaceae bacterium]
VIKAKCSLYLKRGKPATRTSLANQGDFDIVATYGSEYRGLVQYYLLAGDVYRLNRLHGVMRTSLLKTLACKHDSTGQKMAAKYKAKIETPHGLRTCLQVVIERSGREPLVARFGGIPLRRQQKAVLTDRIPERITYPRKELPLRLLKGTCEICERPGHVVVHQVRKLADLGQPGPSQPAWANLMAKRRRKTLVVCSICHDAIHAENPTASLTA